MAVEDTKRIGSPEQKDDAYIRPCTMHDATKALLAACELCVVALRDNLQYDDPEEGSLERTAHDAAVAAIADAQSLPRTAAGDQGQVLEHLEEPEDSPVTFPPAVDPLARMEE